MAAFSELLKAITARACAATGTGQMLGTAALRRDRRRLASAALEQFAVRRQWMIEETEEAIAEADAGEFLSDEMCEVFLHELEAS